MTKQCCNVEPCLGKCLDTTAARKRVALAVIQVGFARRQKPVPQESGLAAARRTAALDRHNLDRLQGQGGTDYVQHVRLV